MTELKHGVELLRELCLAFGPSGCEKEVADIIISQLADTCDEVTVDRMNNVYAWLRGVPSNGAFNPQSPAVPTVLLSSHMDEVGFMICSVDSDGFAKVSTLGGILPTVLPSSRVRMRNYNSTDELRGVFNEKPVHLQKGEYNTAPDINDACIDFGVISEENSKTLKPGAFAIFDSDFYRFGSPLNDCAPALNFTPDAEGVKLKSKALDDRLGCAAMIEAARRLRKSRDNNTILHNAVDVCLAFTVREEVGSSGATVAAYKVAPDFAIILEATAVSDIAETKPAERVADQGSGGALSVADGGTIYDAEFLDFIKNTADNAGIPIQLKRYVSGGNDASKIQRSRGGVRVAALSAPARYIHTPANVIDLRDYFAIRETVIAAVSNI